MSTILGIHFLLFDGFETLDAFGPVEILAQYEGHRLRYFSIKGGPVTSIQGVQVLTESLSSMPEGGVLVLPGGLGTRKLVHDEDFIFALRGAAENSTYCLTICTGSALLAKTGLLEGLKATSNKAAFEWAASVSQKTVWIKKARWTVDGKYYTSSGVSAGMDMALGFMKDLYGRKAAERISRLIEYHWNQDPEVDPFAQ